MGLGSYLIETLTRRGRWAGSPFRVTAARPGFSVGRSKPSIFSTTFQRLVFMTTENVARALVSEREAAHYLNVSQQTVRKLVAKGRLPVVRVGARRLYKVADLDAYIDANRSLTRGS